jgi:hypothetical protein
VDELRQIERGQDSLREEIAAAGEPEPLPMPHRNLAQVYRRKVERLEQALQDPMASAVAVEALRSLIDAIVVYPGDLRGAVRLELRGDLAAFSAPGRRRWSFSVDPAPRKRKNRRSRQRERRFWSNDDIVGCGGRI